MDGKRWRRESARTWSENAGNVFRRCNRVADRVGTGNLDLGISCKSWAVNVFSDGGFKRGNGNSSQDPRADLLFSAPQERTGV